MKIAVIGGGSWGTALARLLAKKGEAVSLWAYEESVVNAITVQHENRPYLPGVPLPKNLTASCEMQKVLEGARVVLFAVPSQHARHIVNQMAPFIKKEIPIVSATKGIEIKTLMFISEVISEAFNREGAGKIAVLSGPSFAQEVAQDHPTAVTLASENHHLALRLQHLFGTPTFKLLITADKIGVELGGALKNVIAIAAGISDGLGFGCNTKAILVARGLSEITSLGIAMGANIKTFYGLSGLGDLFLTCSGALSRNRKVGELLGQGASLESVLGKMQRVAEGVETTKSAVALSKEYKVPMPIVQEVYHVLFEGKPPRQAVADLMAQAYGKEISLEIKGMRQ
ncbi:MAG: NAD(P)-dependent glycerol-3-phosphate dehydrogenase [Nitrospirae bacterium]|nr:NAD(P)-dependent glycerol-3-phosphate dehydrogenase [Candidatus Troglogloeales bacterium]